MTICGIWKLWRSTSHTSISIMINTDVFPQAQTLPDVASIDIQTEIQWFMRPYLVDFLIEAHTAFQLLPETLFLTINLLDRYCSRRIVYKKHYQLVGCSALLIASKFGDRKERVPTIKELKAMCCSLYEEDMFMQMEWHVLQTLDWIVGHPTIDSFLKVALEGIEDPEVGFMACYISEIAMFQKEFVSTRPSDMARTSLALARCVLSRPQALREEWASDYEQQTLVSLSQQLHRPSMVLSRKYATLHNFQVSTTLDRFLARTASINNAYAAPPTPPAERPVDSFGRQFQGTATPITPTKRHLAPSANNGCPTPPETPTEDEHPNKFQKDMAGTRRPTLPSILCSQPIPQAHKGMGQAHLSLPTSILRSQPSAHQHPPRFSLPSIHHIIVPQMF